MVQLKNIVKFLNNYLNIDKIKDKAWNGLQVEGRSEVNKIVFAENASIDIFKKAIKENTDLIVVHHGLFWRKTNPSFRSYTKERIEILTKNGVSLYVAHLPLDHHKEVGNNAQLLKMLGAKIKERFLEYEGEVISWIGEFNPPILAKDIVKKLTKKLNAKCIALLFGPKKIKTMAVCSGGGDYRDFFQALEKGVDLYLTGDGIDIYPCAKDAKFNVIFAGHYATETLGVKALMQVIRKKFKIKTIFIDDPTGL